VRKKTGLKPTLKLQQVLPDSPVRNIKIKDGFTGSLVVAG